MSKTRLFSLVILIFILSVFISGTLFAQGKPPEFTEAPMAPEQPAEENTGFVPPPMDLSHIRPLMRIGIEAEPGPAWDWRANSGVTPVKNQNPWGTCWSFAAIGNLESRILIDELLTYDLSEQNLVSCTDYSTTNPDSPKPVDCSSGANALVATTHLAGYGAALESCDTYPSCPTISCISCPHEKRVDGWRLVANDVAEIKYAVYNHGPVYASMFTGLSEGTTEQRVWRTEFGDYDGSYVLYYDGEGNTNHAVLIVGYDDGLPHVGGTGAWIAKNSWGTEWGDAGYFYIAYGSASIGSNASYYSSQKDFDTKERLYFYDTYGWWSAAGCGNNTAYGLVRITPSDDGWLSHVDFWAVANSESYIIYVYDEFDGSNPSALITSQAGSCIEAGYYSIPLDDPVQVTSGDEISIVVRFVTPDYNFPLPKDNDLPTQANKSYVSCSGSSYTHVGLGSIYGWDLGIRARVQEVECLPGSGPCCDEATRTYRPNTYRCDETTVYSCPYGTGCADDVYGSHRERYCSAASSLCDGDTVWDTWTLADDCTNFEVCSPGFSLCQSPADNDGDGLNYCEELFYGTLDNDPDYDDDLMRDGYEVDNFLDPLVADSMTADFDRDGNPNVHEYFNGTLAGDSLNPDPYCAPGGYCFAESGYLPTSGVLDGPDLTRVRSILRGAGADYSGVIPPNGDSADLNASTLIDGPDVTIYRQLLSGQWSGTLTGAATLIWKTMPSGSSVTGGSTIEVQVLSQFGKPRSGYGVVFWIDSTSKGEGVIYGGEGSGASEGFPALSRYDVTGTMAEGGKARVWLKVDTAGTIRVKAKIPLTAISASKYLEEVPSGGDFIIELSASP